MEVRRKSEDYFVATLTDVEITSSQGNSSWNQGSVRRYKRSPIFDVDLGTSLVGGSLVRVLEIWFLGLRLMLLEN